MPVKTIPSRRESKPEPGNCGNLPPFHLLREWKLGGEIICVVYEADKKRIQGQIGLATRGWTIDIYHACVGTVTRHTAADNQSPADPPTTNAKRR